MKVNFNLKQTSKMQCLTQVMLILTVNKKRIRVYTKLRVYPHEWDLQKQRCMLQGCQPLRRAQELLLINERLQRMDDHIYRLDYERAMRGMYLTVDDVRMAVKESQNTRPDAITPLRYLSLLVDSYSNGINRRGVKGSSGSQTTYRVALQRVENFCKERNYRLTSFDDFDKMFFSEFTHYLYNYRFTRSGTTLHYSAITVINTLKVVKNLLHRAYDNDISKNLYYNKVHTIAQCSCTEKIYLREEEVEKLWQVKTHSRTEQEVRDMFVIACYTGLRISDLNQLRKAVFDENTITLYQVKTREKVQIPILKEISELVKHYREKGFPHISETKSNALIKKLSERAGLVQEVPCRENRGGVVNIKQERKCDLISFHTARRSCITNLFRRGYPVNYIMTLSGHHSLQALQRYIRASQDDMTQAFMDMLKRQNAL